MSRSSPWSRRPDAVPVLLGGVLGALGLLGWIADVDALRRIAPGLPEMKANTAICLLLLSGGVWLAGSPGPRRRWAAPLAAAVAVVALLALAEWTLGLRLGIDELLFRDPDRLTYPGRVSPQTAGSFLLLTLALGAGARSGFGRRLSQAGAVGAGVVAVAALVGHGFGVTTFFGVSTVNGMAPHTALAVLALSAGLMLRDPGHGIVGLLRARGPGGGVARRLLPLAAVFPFGAGGALFKASRAGLLDDRVAWSLYVLTGILLPAAVILRTACVLERVNTQREQAQAARLETERTRADALAQEQRRLATSEARAKALIEHAPEAIVVLDLEAGRFVQANRQAEQLFGLDLGGLRLAGPEDLSPAVQPDGRPSAQAAKAWLEEAARGRTPTFEWVHRSASGDPVLCEVRLLRLPDPERTLIRGSLIDIGDRRRAEQARQLLEAQRLAAEARAEADAEARAKAEALAAELSSLQALTDTTLTLLGVDELLHEVLGRVRDILRADRADTASVLLYDEERGRLRERAIRGRRPGSELPAPRVGEGLAGRVAELRCPLTLRADEPGSDDAAPRPAGLGALLGVPLQVEDRLVGVLQIGTRSSRRLDDGDMRLLQAAGDRIALAVERSRLFDEERAARARAELVGSRQTLLQRLTALLARAADVKQVAQTVISAGAAALGAEAATISRCSGSGRFTVLATAGPPADVVAGWRTYTAASQPIAAEVIRTKRPVLVSSHAERDRRYPEMAGGPVSQQAWANLPLLVDNQPIGIASFAWAGPREFSPDEVELLAAVAQQCANALDRAELLDAERDSRAAAEEAQARLALLADAGELIAGSLDVA